MTNRDWAVLGFRLVGFYLATDYALHAAAFLFRRAGAEGPDIAQVVTYAVVLAAVWGGADRLASWVFPHESTTDLTLEGRSDQQFLAPALSIMGVYLIAEALPSVVDAIGALVGIRGVGRSVFGGAEDTTLVMWRAMREANAVAGGVRLLLGVVLVLYPNRLAAVAVALRRDEGLTDRPTDEEQEPDGEQGRAPEDDRT